MSKGNQNQHFGRHFGHVGVYFLSCCWCPSNLKTFSNSETWLSGVCFLVTFRILSSRPSFGFLFLTNRPMTRETKGIPLFSLCRLGDTGEEWMLHPDGESLSLEGYILDSSILLPWNRWSTKGKGKVNRCLSLAPAVCHQDSFLLCAVERRSYGQRMPVSSTCPAVVLKVRNAGLVFPLFPFPFSIHGCWKRKSSCLKDPETGF